MSKSKFLALIVITATALLLQGCIDGESFRSVSTLKGFGKIMLPRFIAHGANSIDVSNVVKKLDARPTDNWAAAWSELAKDYETKGAKNLENNNLEDAKYQLLKASVYYRIAAYPYPLDDQRREAFDRSVKLFQQYIKFLDNPPQLISLSLETRRISGYFRKPAKAQRCPLVILLPGIDYTKEEMYWVEESFLEKGFATFSMDIPGSAGTDWALRGDSDRMITKALKYFQADSSIIPDKIAFVGFNFGGYWALKVAAQNTGIRGVVAISAPIHKSFDVNHLNQMPRFMADIFLKVCGVLDYQEMFKILGAMSLKDQDLLRDIRTPVFIIASEADFFVPQEDLLLLPEDLKQPTSIKLYKDQPFGVVENLDSEVYPMIADWIEEQFTK